MGTSKGKWPEGIVKYIKKSEERTRKEEIFRRRRNQEGQRKESRWLGRGSITIISFIKVVERGGEEGGREGD